MDPNAEGGPPKAEIEIAEVETPPTPARRGTADVEITAQAPAQEHPSSELSEKEKAKLEKLERKRLRQEKKERKEARAQKRLEKQEKRERREREKEQAAAAAAAQSAAQPAAEPLPETAQPETPAQPKVDPEIQASIKERLRASGAPISDIKAPMASSIFRSAQEPGWDKPQEETDPAKIQQFHEEEFQRRLRGEYQAQQLRTGQVVTNSMEKPLRLTSIRLSPPPPTTRGDFLSGLLAPFLSEAHPWLKWLHPVPPPPTNLREILQTTKALVQHVDDLGVFDMDRVGIRLEPAPSGDPDEVELILALRERGRYFLKAGTEFGGNEGGANITGRIRNVLGGGETLEANAALGTKTKSAYQATLSTPVFSSPYLSASISGFSLDRDNTAFASHRELQQGGRVKLSGLTPLGAHELAYEYVQRNISHLSPKASVSIRELANTTTKASLSHTWTSDTRDSALGLGTSGRLLKLTNEYAGLPGSSELAHFIKSTGVAQASRPLYKGSDILVSVSGFGSILYPLWAPGSFDEPRRTYLADRTYLGGPNSVRGWKVGGLGLSDKLDSLGGDLAYAVGASAFLPIPGKEHWPLKIHTFLNAGKVTRYEQRRSFVDNVSKMVSMPSVSAGIGLMYRFDPLRIELNFSMPLVARQGERLARGFSVGVGIDFL